MSLSTEIKLFSVDGIPTDMLFCHPVPIGLQAYGLWSVNNILLEIFIYILVNDRLLERNIGPKSCTNKRINTSGKEEKIKIYKERFMTDISCNWFMF